MKKLKEILLRAADGNGEVVIRVVGETGELWHGRHLINDKWWPPPPNYYIYRKIHWVKA